MEDGKNKQNPKPATELFGTEGDLDRAVANAELGAVLEHCGTNTAFLKEGAVRGIEILEVHEGVTDFEDAVMARDFGIVEREVGTLAADDRSAFS